MKYQLSFWIFLSSLVFSQSNAEDDINAFHSSKSDVEKAQLASDIAWELRNSLPDSSLHYAEEALRLSVQTNQPKIQAYSLADIGNYYKRSENYLLALKYYKNSLSVREKIKDLELTISGYNQIALLFKQQEKYDSAAYYFETGLSLLKQKPNSVLTLKLYDGYAMTLYHLGEAERALAYLDSSYVLAENVQDSAVIANVLQRKGVIRQYLGQPSLALKYYAEADAYFHNLGDINGEIDIKINQASVYQQQGQMDEAEKALLAAEKQSIQNGFKNNLFSIYTNLADLYQNELPRSKAYYEKAYENAERFNKVPAQIETGIALGFIALKQDEVTEAGQRIQEIDSLMQSNVLKTPIILDFYRLKAGYFKALNDYQEAYRYANKAMWLKDSVHNELNHLQDLSAILDHERNEKKLALEALKTSRAENERIVAESRLSRLVMWSLVVILFFLILLFLGRRKRLKIAHEKKMEKQRFKTALKQKEVEADLLFLQESLKLETKIRQKIGRDLHDNLGSKLAVIQISLEGISQNKPENRPDEEKELERITELVEQSCEEMRTISHDLIQQNQAAQSLHFYLKNYVDTILQTGALEIDYNLVGEPYDVSFQMKKHIYAVVSLLLDNVIKHAQAKEASLQLFYHEDSINFEIIDNGIGFNHNGKRKKGVGLNNAQHRIQQLNGTIDIDSNHGKGTIISITIPTTV
jgi:signal transduction histidine kinase